MLTANKFTLFKLLFLFIYVRLSLQEERSCQIPEVIRGAWFSWENRNVRTVIDAESMSGRGQCILMKKNEISNHTFVFKKHTCYHCVQLVTRTLNILDKTELECIELPESVEPTIENICQGMDRRQQITLFSEFPRPVNCRSSLEGVWQFAYQNRFRFTGECNHEDAEIRSCQTAGSQFMISNQKFNITYKKCDNMNGTMDAVVEYSCLGDWFVNKNHYFAVVNTKETRIEEKYRCFLKNRDDEKYIGMSLTPECNTLSAIDDSPIRLHITQKKSEVVEPRCKLAQNMTGPWINLDYKEANVVINDTHIEETWYPDTGRERKTIYVCMQKRDTRVMMARLDTFGCQKDYICYDFIPRHHNIIRYRRSIAVIQDDFSVACSWRQFQNQIKWKYSLLVAKDPIPIRCPIAGKFQFTQRGDHLFETRILGGVTVAPRPELYCQENISDFSNCDFRQREINIKKDYCLTLDWKGRPVDIYSDPDYKLQCVGYFLENIKSYLITYDVLDPASVYRCWVYQRTGLNRIIMSQAAGPVCSLDQTAKSYNWTEGAALAIDMTEYERERDECPLFFDTGAYPWATTENNIIVFKFNSNSACTSKIIFSVFILNLVFIYLGNF
ncbi:uncharacterized protein LOC123266064 [Cotesia glomerata]|uniref:Uncharacterized protein n=1 Tax=Cotesia glomerata TaxID=32391 RepID=A0AAV7II01_COTGL|nr:uncharacterized protein LOC123266064 [Cotesia glomerata]KAH0561156.1 hypothetical protein KQX54_013862 [Cotesia glomerata]